MKKIYLLIIMLALNSGLILAQETDPQEAKEGFQILDSLIGGFIGGILGVLGTIASSYWGPRKLEEWRNKETEERLNGPKKKLLLTMLNDPKFTNGRRIKTLARVIGTDYDECRRLLVEIQARGLISNEDSITDHESWALIKNKPLIEE